VTWGFIWIMLILKIPLAALIYVVWWAIKQEPEQPESSDEGGGGGVRRVPHGRHPRKPFPHAPRRGPHGGMGGDRFLPPARIRTVRAKARTFDH
jgi:hypothetical protein